MSTSEVLYGLRHTDDPEDAPELSPHEARTDPKYHADRPSSRTADEREAHFNHWFAKYGAPYEAAVTENGGTPWTDDMDERRALWQRRYQRPAPPANLPALSGIPRSHAPITRTAERNAA